MHKRAYGAVAVSGVAALALSACGGSSPTPSTTSAAGSTSTATTTTAAAATTTTTAPPVRDANADLVVWTDADRGPAFTALVKKFADDNGVTAQVQVAAKTREQFKDATKVGKGPDVVIGAHDWLGEYVQNDVVAPVNLSADLAAKFDPGAIAAAKFNGQTYGVPFATENLALMRNTALAPDAPATMDDLVKVGTEIKAKSGGKVTNVLIQPVGKTGNAYYSYPYLSAFGGGIFAQKDNGDYDPSKVLVNSAGSIKGAEVMAALGKAGVLSTNVGDDNAEGLFDAGKAPFMITGPWGTVNAKKANIKYAVSNLPSLAGGGAMKPFLGVQLAYVSSKAKNAAIAQEFATKYLTSKDVQLELFKSIGRPPALKEAYDQVAATDADIKAFVAAGKGALPMPNIPAMNSVWGPLGQAAADVVAGRPAKARFDAAAAEIVASIAKG